LENFAMKVALFSLIGIAIAACASPVAAKEPVAAQPIGSPGAWVNSADYPAAALHLKMSGVTAFRLGLDSTGKPIRCEIAGSSGFDLLDEATCKRLVNNARFSPALDEAGKPREGIYSGRVRWVLPPVSQRPVSESFASLFVSMDQSGKATSCRVKVHVPIATMPPGGNTCDQLLRVLSPTILLALRENAEASSLEVEVQKAYVFTPALRSQVLAPVAGYDVRALNIHHFTVTSDGKMGQCNYEQQRGSDLLVQDFCASAGGVNYDAPFAAFDKDGLAKGWHIARVLLKTSK
jgi:TonB family protein